MASPLDSLEDFFEARSFAVAAEGRQQSPLDAGVERALSGDLATKSEWRTTRMSWELTEFVAVSRLVLAVKLLWISACCPGSTDSVIEEILRGNLARLQSSLLSE